MSDNDDSEVELCSLLESHLPKSSIRYRLINLVSQSKKSKPIFYKNKNTTKSTTVKIQHFISILQDKVIFFGIEVFVYIILDKDETSRVLFISKADTTGLFDKDKTQDKINVNIGELVKDIMKYLLRIPLSYYLDDVIVKLEKDKNIKHEFSFSNKFNNNRYVTSTERSLRILIERLHQNKDINKPLKTEGNNRISHLKLEYNDNHVVDKICLFTRPERQYLFPYSYKNTKKHLLNGEQLLKWWCNIINEVSLTEFDNKEIKLTIPGSEFTTTERYLPNKTNWSIGDIFHDNNHKDSNHELAINAIPLFPDDPKGRFFEHLVVENRIKKISIAQFWLELSIRQEFRLGVVVGVIGVKGNLHKKNFSNTNELIKLNNKNLKKLKTIIIEQDYSNDIDEIEKIYNYINCLSINHIFKEIHGKKLGKLEKQNHQANTIIPQTNDLNGLVKRKLSSPTVNNLNGLVKRRKKPIL
ncbi:hypothetical protein PACTADRAFT_49835 [Pachysolen tannophilus NRRL Y-2460]|uniref:histone acetyltransferase n=1 Tax=Pachysolen tannophilus NRRL Y-2460 TaxID=669874 RepID=A0A1E4TXP7_PACTA|nr:hypothetical protein PACTADRAFT_49835 [Pachysolen tannophilus NRRL Y-2460]